MNEIVGIRNLGQTCYVNALIQAFLHSTPMQNFLRGLPIDHDEFERFVSTQAALRPIPVLQLISALASMNQERIIDLQPLVELFGIDCHVYDDANQIYKVLYDQLQQECKIADAKLETPYFEADFLSYLNGVCVLQIRCVDCNWCSETKQQFSDLTILPFMDLFASLQRILCGNEITEYHCKQCNGLHLLQTQAIREIGYQVVLTVCKSRTKILIPVFLDFFSLTVIADSYLALNPAQQTEFLRTTMMPWCFQAKDYAVRLLIESMPELREYLSYYEYGKCEAVNAQLANYKDPFFTRPQVAALPRYLYYVESVISQIGSQNQGHYTSTVVQHDAEDVFRAYILNDTTFSCLTDFYKAYLTAQGLYEAYTQISQQGYMFFFKYCAADELVSMPPELLSYAERYMQYNEQTKILSVTGGLTDQYEAEKCVPAIENGSYKSTLRQELEYSIALYISEENSPFSDLDQHLRIKQRCKLEISSEATLQQLIDMCGGFSCNYYLYALFSERDYIKRQYICSKCSAGTRLTELFARVCRSAHRHHFLLLDRSFYFRTDSLYVHFGTVHVNGDGVQLPNYNGLDFRVSDGFSVEIVSEELSDLAEIVSDRAERIQIKNGKALMQLLQLKLLYSMHYCADFESTSEMSRRLFSFNGRLEQLGLCGFCSDFEKLWIENGQYVLMERCDQKVPFELSSYYTSLGATYYSKICRALADCNLSSVLFLYYQDYPITKMQVCDLQCSLKDFKQKVKNLLGVNSDIKLQFLTKTLHPLVVYFDDSQSMASVSTIAANYQPMFARVEFIQQRCGLAKAVFTVVNAGYEVERGTVINCRFDINQSIKDIVAGSFLRYFFASEDAFFVIYPDSPFTLQTALLHRCETRLDGSTSGKDVRVLVFPGCVANLQAFEETTNCKRDGAFVVKLIMWQKQLIKKEHYVFLCVKDDFSAVRKFVQAFYGWEIDYFQYCYKGALYPIDRQIWAGSTNTVYAEVSERRAYPAEVVNLCGEAASKQ